MLQVCQVTQKQLLSYQEDKGYAFVELEPVYN